MVPFASKRGRLMKLVKLALAAAALAVASPSAAQEWPMKAAEYVDMTGVHIDDGHSLDYANWLSTQWRASQDYAMEQGWITGYEILQNSYSREGEPDLYLVVRWTEWESPEEEDRRAQMFRQHMQTTIAKMQSESAGRAEYRTVGSSMLLRRLVWRK